MFDSGFKKNMPEGKNFARKLEANNGYWKIKNK